MIPNFTHLNGLPSYKESVVDHTKNDFTSEKINIKQLDYFFTNAISRASKTMSECRQIKQNLNKTGTND